MNLFGDVVAAVSAVGALGAWGSILRSQRGVKDAQRASRGAVEHLEALDPIVRAAASDSAFTSYQLTPSNGRTIAQIVEDEIAPVANALDVHVKDGHGGQPTLRPRRGGPRKR